MSEPAKAIEPWMTTEELALRLRVTRRTISNYVAQGCPHHKLSQRNNRFEYDLVVAWLRDRTPSKP
jgi:excisionase family DNA binding protein